MTVEVEKILSKAKREIEKATGFEIVSINFSTKPTVNQVFELKKAICKAYNLNWADIQQVTRVRDIVAARQMFYYILTVHFRMGLVEAGKLLGHDHTTVVHARNKVRGFLSINDEETISKYKLVNNYLNEGYERL